MHLFDFKVYPYAFKLRLYAFKMYTHAFKINMYHKNVIVFFQNTLAYDQKYKSMLPECIRVLSKWIHTPLKHVYMLSQNICILSVCIHILF